TLEMDLVFKVKRKSFATKSDGSISVLIKCPVETCVEGYTVTFKGYRNKNIKKPENATSKATARWQYSALKNHLLRYHSNGGSMNSDDVSLADSVDNSINEKANDGNAREQNRTDGRKSGPKPTFQDVVNHGGSREQNPIDGGTSEESSELHFGRDACAGRQFENGTVNESDLWLLDNGWLDQRLVVQENWRPQSNWYRDIEDNNPNLDSLSHWDGIIDVT
ncbi:hypothetical protein Bhyg_16592, partial [Pseudolycoriella hygida]